MGKFHDLNPWQVCETLPSLLHWSPSLRAIERDSPRDTHAIHLLWQQLQVVVQRKETHSTTFSQNTWGQCWTWKTTPVDSASGGLCHDESCPFQSSRPERNLHLPLGAQLGRGVCQVSMIRYMTPEILGSSSLDIYRLLLQGIQLRRNWCDDRLSFTSSKFSGQARQIIISPSAFTVMKPKSKKIWVNRRDCYTEKAFSCCLQQFSLWILPWCCPMPSRNVIVSLCSWIIRAILKPYCWFTFGCKNHMIMWTQVSCRWSQQFLEPPVRL